MSRYALLLASYELELAQEEKALSRMPAGHSHKRQAALVDKLRLQVETLKRMLSDETPKEVA